MREVSEETGLEGRLRAELPPSRYVDQEGRRKVVRYWTMEVLDGRDLHPTMEVDDAKWFTLAEARGILSYDRDREVLDAAAGLDVPAYLLRHAKAGDREAWPGDDDSRPLSNTGRRQAKGLVRVLADVVIKRILSSPAVRCVESVRPLSEQRGLPIEPRDELRRGCAALRPARVARRAPIPDGLLRTRRPDPGSHRALRGTRSSRRTGSGLEEGLRLGVGTGIRARRACDLRPATPGWTRRCLLVATVW